MSASVLRTRVLAAVILLAAGYFSTVADATVPPQTAFSYGIIGRDGTEVVPPACDSMTWSGDGWVSLRRADKEGFFNLFTGHGTGLVFDAIDDRDIPLFEEGLEPVRNGHLYGYADRAGRLRIPFEFEAARQFRSGLAVVKRDGKFGYIDSTGRFVLPPIYDAATAFDPNGLAQVQIGRKWGAIDLAGQITIPTRYDSISKFSDAGMASVSIGDLWGAVDLRGKLLVPVRFKALYPFHKNGVAAASLDNDGNNVSSSHWGLIDTSGNFVVAPIYQRIGDFESPGELGGPEAPPGLAAAYSIDALGQETTHYIDAHGTIAFSLPKGLSGGQVEKQGLVHVFNTSATKRLSPSGRSGLFDLAHPEQGPLWFDDIGEAGAFGLTPVKVGTDWGYIDRSMKMVIPPQFGSASAFRSDGLAIVSIRQDDRSFKTAFIDRQGKIVPQTKYMTVTSFTASGTSQVTKTRRATDPLDYPIEACRVAHPLNGSGAAN